MKKPGLIQETMSIRKSRQRERIQGGKREKRYDLIAIYFGEIIH